MADRERGVAAGRDVRAREGWERESDSGSQAHGGGAFREGWDDAPCAICGSRRGGAHLHLTHAVTVWLCPAHRDGKYLAREQGAVFAQRLAEIWAVTGALTSRRVSALRGHLRRVAATPGARPRPGSYSWPVLRREAESRFAAGDPPAVVIDELRQRHRHDPADVPTVRTMRRWFAQGRWLASPDVTAPPPRRASRRTKPRSRILRYIDTLPRGMAIAALHPWYLPPTASRSP